MSTVEPSRERVAVTVPPAVAHPYRVRETVCDDLFCVLCLSRLDRAVAVEADAGVIGRYVDRVARRRIQVRRYDRE